MGEARVVDMGAILAELQARATSPEAVAEAEKREAARRAAREAYKARCWRDKVAEYAPVRAAAKAFAPDQTQAVKVVESWIAKGCERDLVLRGGVGTGKTTAACVAVKAWVEPEIVAWDGPDWAESNASMRHKVSWLRPDALVSAVMHDYDERSPKLYKYVVIDDMGRETRADFVEALCELLDREGHTLLITTNLTREQMRERYDIRVLDRLNDRAIAVDLKGASLRKQNGGF